MKGNPEKELPVNKDISVAENETKIRQLEEKLAASEREFRKLNERYQSLNNKEQ